MKIIAHSFKLAIILSIICSSCFAVAPEVVLNNRKQATPMIKEKITTMPTKFHKMNNLRRVQGSPFLAKGEYLFFEGYITDLLGNPVENAKIYLWQTNMFGYYNHLIRQKEDDSKYDIDFIGTGSYVTDNMGYYNFTTIMPGYYKNRAPHLILLIKHEFFPEDFQTEIFFPGHPKNLEDDIYTTLSEQKRHAATCKITDLNPKNPADGKYALFNIRLDWIHPYRN
jgi:protocatechuate 3,4-dioxygenase beta subunit